MTPMGMTTQTLIMSNLGALSVASSQPGRLIDHGDLIAHLGQERDGSMSDFTIEQLEALKEGTTPGPWEINPLSGNVASFSHGEIACNLSCPSDHELIMAAPALVDALIAEKRAHQKLRSEVEGMKSAFEDRPSPHDDYLYAQGWEYALDLVDTDLTRILEGDNG